MSRYSIVLCAILVALVSVSLAEFTEEQKQLMRSVHDACVGESGTNDATIEGLKKGNFPDDEPLKCYLKCVYQQMTVMDDDGVLDGETMLSLIPDDMATFMTPMVKKCQNTGGSTPCDRAFQFNKCLYEADPTHYIVF